MKFTASRADLLQVMSRVDPARTDKPGEGDQSSCFIFDDGMCVAFGPKLCCQTESGLPQEFRAAVPGRPLRGALENFSDQTLTVEMIGSELRLSAGRKRAGIRADPEIRAPVQSVDVPQAWARLPAPQEFADSAVAACKIAGRNPNEVSYSAVRLTAEFLEATDSYRAVRYRVPTGAGDCLVSAKSLLSVAPMQMVWSCETDAWMHYRNRLVTVSLLKDAVAFPPMGPLWSLTGEPVELPKGGAEVTKLGQVFTSDDRENNRVTVKLTARNMHVRGDGALGYSACDVECEYQGPPVQFRIDPEVLLHLIRTHNQCELLPGKLLVRGDTWMLVNVLQAVPQAVPRPERPAVPDCTEEDESDE